MITNMEDDAWRMACSARTGAMIASTGARVTVNRPSLVSIVMPVFQCESTIAASVRSIVAQTYQNWELLIIGDGCTDRSLDVAADFRDSRIQIIAHKKNVGLSARLNEGVALSRGEYIARMDGDDICYPTRLTAQINFLESHPEVDLLGSSIVLFR